MTNIRGLVPMLVTPFTDDDEIDEAALRSLVRFQLDCRVDGLAVLGIGGEGYAVTADERDRIVRIVRDESGTRLPLVVGVAATSARLAIADAVRSEQAGADCLMVLPPFLVKPDAPRLLDFYRAVAGAVTVPVMVQDAPEVGVPISVRAFEALAAIPQITYAKIEPAEPVPKMASVHSALGSALTLVGGRGGRTVLDEFAHGASGTVPFCDLSDYFRLILDHVNAGDVGGAQDVFNVVLPVLDFSATSGAGQAVAKEILRCRGILPNSRVRNPSTPLNDQMRREVGRLFDATQGRSPELL